MTAKDDHGFSAILQGCSITSLNGISKIIELRCILASSIHDRKLLPDMFSGTNSKRERLDMFERLVPYTFKAT
ncbi:hypothetical protein PIB30_087630 [Stylosanthes scabra]|uniref:Uncharacterized protein n=1 Tax=Stylosanthes scabra TaxID=79078 RepID=A0ABU6QT09_9FABA|nr:hypothetical protein [Stylosanthes scabra]